MGSRVIVLSGARSRRSWVGVLGEAPGVARSRNWHFCPFVNEQPLIGDCVGLLHRLNKISKVVFL